MREARALAFHLLTHKTAPVLIPTMHLTGGIACGLFALLAHKTTPVLIPTMHLTGGIACGLFALLAHKTAPYGLFALELSTSAPCPNLRTHSARDSSEKRDTLSVSLPHSLSLNSFQSDRSSQIVPVRSFRSDRFKQQQIWILEQSCHVSHEASTFGTIDQTVIE